MSTGVPLSSPSSPRCTQAPPYESCSKQAVYGANAEAVYRSIEEQATQDCWFEGEFPEARRSGRRLSAHPHPSLTAHLRAALNIRRTFMTEQAMLNLHVWLLHKRHMLDFFAPGAYNGRLADKLLFECFWDDTTHRIRSAGVQEMSVNKQLEMVQKAAFLDMFEYDCGAWWV